MRRRLKCGCDILVNRIYLCQNHAYLIEVLMRLDTEAEANRTLDGNFIDVKLIEGEVEDATKHE